MNKKKLEHESYYLLKLSDEDYDELCAEAMGIESESGKHSGEDNIYSIKHDILQDDQWGWGAIDEFLHVIREIRTKNKSNTIEGMILGDFIVEERWDYWLSKHKEDKLN